MSLMSLMSLMSRSEEKTFPCEDRRKSPARLHPNPFLARFANLASRYMHGSCR